MPLLIRDPGTHSAQIYLLKSGLNTIGREKDNHVMIVDTNKSLSRRHAAIEVTEDTHLIRDLRSSNHTFVNGVKIQQCELRDGDTIRFGGVVCRFALDIPEKRPQRRVPEKEFSIVRQVAPTSKMTDLLAPGELSDKVLRLREQQDRDVQRTADKLRILLEVSKQLSIPGSFDRLLDKILELLFEIMTVDRAVLLLIDETTGCLEPKATKSSAAITPEEQLYSTRIANFVMEHGDAVLTNDAREDQRFNVSDSIMLQAIRASMCVPLKLGTASIGALYVDHQSMTSIYTDEDLEFLIVLATQAAIAINNARLSQLMQSEAVIRTRLERFFPKVVSQKIQNEEDLGITETEVTALFSDITGFTQIASKMEPQQVLELLNEYFAVMVEDIVFRYEGTLEKYIADALLAVWGSPYQRPDDVSRAIRAAIEMQWAMQHLNQQWAKQRDIQWQIHIGLNTGKVVAGNIGSKQLIQYTHIGDAMNVASRICSIARAGEILISQSTLNQLGSAKLPVAALPPVVVKGKDQPLHLYRVLWQQVQSQNKRLSKDTL